MSVCVVSSIRSSSLHCSYRTPEDGTRELLYLTHDAGVVSLEVEAEGKETGSLYAVSVVRPAIVIGPADLGCDLGDVSVARETGGVRVSRWGVVQVVLGGHPGQVAGQPGVDCRVS